MEFTEDYPSKVIWFLWSTTAKVLSVHTVLWLWPAVCTNNTVVVLCMKALSTRPYPNVVVDVDEV